MSDLDDAVSATADGLSRALLRLARAGPRQQAQQIAEEITETAHDLHAAASSPTAPSEYTGWAVPVSDSRPPDAIPPEWTQEAP